MTQTKAIALFVLVVDSLLYLKTVLYPPTHPWAHWVRRKGAPEIPLRVTA